LHHGGGKVDRGIDLAGNVIIHPIVDPLLVILDNQEFVFLFWIAIPLGIWMAFRKAVSPAVRHAVIVFGGVGLFWFLCAGAAHDLLPLNPSYFLITALGATVVTALALAELLRNQSQRLVLVALFLLIGGNIAGIYVENRNSLFGEKALAAVTQRYSGTLYTDPMTRYRADLLLTWKDAAERVSGDAPHRAASTSTMPHAPTGRTNSCPKTKWAPTSRRTIGSHWKRSGLPPKSWGSFSNSPGWKTAFRKS